MGRHRKDLIKQKEKEKKLQKEKQRDGGGAKGKKDHKTVPDDASLAANVSQTSRSNTKKSVSECEFVPEDTIQGTPVTVPECGGENQPVNVSPSQNIPSASSASDVAGAFAPVNEDQHVTDDPDTLRDNNLLEVQDDDSLAVNVCEMSIRDLEKTVAESEVISDDINQTPVTVLELKDFPSVELVNSDNSNLWKKRIDEVAEDISQFERKLEERCTYCAELKGKIDQLVEEKRENDYRILQLEQDLEKQLAYCQQLEAQKAQLEEEMRQFELNLTNEKETKTTCTASIKANPCRVSKSWNIEPYKVKEEDRNQRYTKVFEAIDLFRLLEHSRTKTEASACRNMDIIIEEPWLIEEFQVENLQVLIDNLHENNDGKVFKEPKITVRTCVQKEFCHESLDCLVRATIDKNQPWFHNRCLRFRDGFVLHLPAGIHLWDKNSWIYTGGVLTLNQDASFTDAYSTGPRSLLYSRTATGRHTNGLDLANLYINNLPQDCDKRKLDKRFEKYGKIVSSKVVADFCYGFVKFDNPNSAQDAIAGENGELFDGKRLTVKLKD